MVSTTARRAQAIGLLALLTVSLLLAGCMGDDPPKQRPDDDGATYTPDAQVQSPQEEGIDPMTPTGEPDDDDTAHHHDQWLGREAVFVWRDAPVRFQQFDLAKVGSHGTLTWAGFGFEDDDSQVDDPNTHDPAPENHADVVFGGTANITVTFPDRFFDGVDRLHFYHQAADTNAYTGPTLVRPGDTLVIPLDRIGMADPPHQNAVSRWRFLLVVAEDHEQHPCMLGAPTTEPACPPAFAREAPQDPNDPKLLLHDLEMIAHNGGTASLDPPHPDFWQGADTLWLGETAARADEPVLWTPLLRQADHPLDDLRLPSGSTVPMGTGHVTVEVEWTADPATPLTRLRLFYHGADTTVYQAATPTTEPGCEGAVCTRSYRIDNVVGGVDQGLVDPPYEAQSFWRFALAPSDIESETPRGEARIGAFQGDVSLRATAHRAVEVFA
ncbi:MAG: hypothetical protein KY455_10840 [Euryarchaeota archaeon]|nr:hypothetical protein [Euryarchaeota archaeon]